MQRESTAKITQYEQCLLWLINKYTPSQQLPHHRHVCLLKPPNRTWATCFFFLFTSF